MKVKDVIKKWSFRIATFFLSILTFSKPVQRDRRLFGNNGGGMVGFAIWIAVLVPLIIWGIMTLVNPKTSVNELLLTNYDTDTSELQGEIKGGVVTLKANEDKPHHGNFWAILAQYTDPGNLPSAKNGDGGYLLALICALAGVFCLSGLAVSSLISFINRTNDRWKQGLLRYNWWFNNYVVIIGCNKQTANLIKLSLTRKDVDYVLIMTRQNVHEMRMKLDLDLDKDEEKKLVFYYAERTSREDIEDLHLEKALDIFILGEDVDYDNEEDHDVFNISCLENISEYLKSAREKKAFDKKSIHVNLEYQSTFTAFKYTHIYRSLDKTVEFLPYNIHEIWAKKILIDNFAIVPIGKKGEVQVQNYLPIDSADGIKADDNKTVHLIIVGMNQMGTALGVQAALLSHFPNAHRDRDLRTTITFIDDQAVKEGEYLRGRFATLFDLCRYRIIDASKNEFEKDWFDPMVNGRYKHLGENFMDIQWEFIQGNVASNEIRDYLQSISENKDKVTTIAICFNHPQRAVAAALYLPEMVYRRAMQILVYQQNSFDLATKISTGEKVWKRYEKLKPFGMIEGSYSENAFDNPMAKILYYLYATQRIKNYTKNKDSIDYFYFSVPELSSFEQLNVDLARKINDLWNQQGIVNKLSNIDMVDSIPMKLRSLGLTIDSIDGYRQVLKSGRNLELLAKAEHTRWLTERTTMGYRPLDDVDDEWRLFINPDLDETTRKRYKEYRKYKSRAHLDICSNTTLNELEPGIHYNDIAVISYIPQLLRYKEWLNFMKLADEKSRDSISGKLLLDFVTFTSNRTQNLCLRLVESNDNAFWIMDTTVTQKQWKAIMGNNPTPEVFQDEDKPVVNVSKLDIDDFLKVLRKRIGLFMDLPSKDEWKIAAIQSIGDVPHKAIEKYLRISKGSEDKAGPDKVRSHSNINKDGAPIFNMLGNVWEWTRTENPKDKGCFYFCGGSWRFKTLQCNLVKEYWNSFWKPILKSDDIGFRLVWRFDVRCLDKNKVHEISQTLSDVSKSAIPVKTETAPEDIIKFLDKHMIPIETGYFVMGTENKETIMREPLYPKHWIDREASEDETPHHFVKIRRFKIGSTPVTQELWNMVMGTDAKANKSEHLGFKKPQTNVSWDEIVNGFIRKLNDITGLKFRLPSEAEWEYVSKGGHDNPLSKELAIIFENDTLSVEEKKCLAYESINKSSPYKRYGSTDNADDLDLKVLSTTINVESRQPIVIDGKEIYDMNGNIWEWCSDYYQTNFYAECVNSSEYRQNGYVENPICEDNEYAAHSFRGGSWRFDAKNCRCTSVNYWISSNTDDDLGFRLALDF